MRLRNVISYVLVGFVMLLSLNAFATHNRAGEIIYKRVGSDPFLYEISIITYTKTGGQSDAADRCYLELFFGDGTSEEIDRVNGPLNQGCNDGVGSGEMITSNTRYNIYTTRHTFPGAGTFKLSMEDPMRNGGVVNIEKSDNVPFYLESYLTIDIGTGGNQAPVLQNPPIDNGCVGVPFLHNPGAVDAEGDSLVYSIVPSRTWDGAPISSYRFPDEVNAGENNNLSIDPHSGTLTWDAPQLAGEYNVAILIEEYRRNPNNGEVFKVGSVLRDMQIDIGNCPENLPPFILLNEEVCIDAGQVLVEKVQARDPEDDNIKLTAVGHPLNPGNGGTFEPSDSAEGKPPITLTLRWQTECSDVRYAPYWVYFKAKESTGQNSDLVDFKAMAISVVSPGVTITSIEPQGTTLKLDWTSAVCKEASGYDIYRYSDSLGYVPSQCQTGIPGALGYKKIGTVKNVNTTTFIDDDKGKGLVHGQRYCYMIVTTFDDGSESYPSPENCGKLIRDVPVLNKVSVNVTDSVNGSDSIAWFKPVEMNTDVFLPPYRYRLLRSTEQSGNYEEVYLSDASQDPFTLDTMFRDQGLNTRDQQYFYKIEMLSGVEQRSIGASRFAASIYLTSEPSDNTLTLSWDVNVPWTNSYYVVYRFFNHPDSNDKYFVLDTVQGTSYVDTRLANLKPYRYFVLGVGKYSAEELQGNLYNYSQIHTGIPEDNEAPCPPPNRLINADCDLDETRLNWDNPNEVCDDVDDVLSYNLYYAPILGEPLQLLTNIDDPNTTTFVRGGERSIAGCFAITAIDSFDNESGKGQPLCVDNCPIYELPNVFTPGEDGRNDLFTPFPYKYIESIDIIIYNRWGVEVFKSKDPDINWDGTDMKTKNPLPSGVYYYICQVNEIRLTGIETREIKGDIHLLREKEKGPLAP